MLAVVGVVVVIATMGLVIAAMYLGGGTAAIRRQVPQLGLLLAAALVAVLFAIPLLMRGLGDLAFSLVLVGLNVAVLMAWALQSRRGEGPLISETWSRAFSIPRFRTLVLAWGAFIVIGTVLLMLAASSRS